MCTAAPTAACATLTEADSRLVDRVLPSPNFGDRRGRTIDALILHYTGMASGDAALARLLDPSSEVSAHFLVWEDGRIDQLVAEDDRAWHAGRSYWAGERDLNAVSIGIEIVNGGHDFDLPSYPDAQLQAVVALVRDVTARRAIPPARVLGHSDIAPDRKKDPGERFPWHRLSQAALALTAPQIAADDRRGVTTPTLRDALSAIGYDGKAAMVDPNAPCHVLLAFQRRWRQELVDGLLDTETASLVATVMRAAAT